MGGGIVGLASAWYLARAGVEVIVLERDAAGRAASWAAGGMLCAHIEHECDDPRFSALARAIRVPGVTSVVVGTVDVSHWAANCAAVEQALAES